MQERDRRRGSRSGANMRRRRRDPIKARIIALLAAGIAMIGVILICIFLFAPAFNIESVACEGNYKINSDTIIETSGIQTGNNIFLTSLSDKEEMVEALDYIEKCEIRRDLPHKIVITVTERHPSAYFNLTGALAVADMNGEVLEVIGGADAEDIVSAKITEEEPEPSASPDPDKKSDPDEPDPESTADGTIWGYDDDGDPIYRINGGHYEFDDDGNRFFVDDTPEESAEPSNEPSEYEQNNGDGLQRTKQGTVIYSAPVVYGVDIKKYDVGKKLESDDSNKLELVMNALRALDSAGLLERTTKFDVEDIGNVKFTIEDRLQVWFGTFDEFEYKAKFTASVIDNNLSSHERAIIDFRDSKLYVRSANYKTPEVLDPLPEPSEDADEDSKKERDYADENDSKSDTKSKTPRSTSKPAKKSAADDEEYVSDDSEAIDDTYEDRYDDTDSDNETDPDGDDELIE